MMKIKNSLSPRKNESYDMHSQSGSDSQATVDYGYDNSMLVEEVQTSSPMKENPGTPISKKTRKFQRGKKDQFKTLLNVIAEFF